MKNILILGAGKSATALIRYLIKEAKKLDAYLTIVDQDPASARKKTGTTQRAAVRSFNIKDPEKRKEYISRADLVISLLPSALHALVARDCITFKKTLLTPSYISPEIQHLKKDIEKAGILLMGEMGLDPGIDHMSAMSAIEEIRKKAGYITSFESFCGALVAPESDDNPWHYKISWSPASLITSGKDGAAYREGGKIQTIPYETLFGSYKTIAIPGMDRLAYYPNRNSERYARLYGLDEVPSILRATLRHPDFCEGWQMIVSLGLTDTTQKFKTDHLTYRKWLDTAVRQSRISGNTSSKIYDDSRFIRQQFAFLGLLDDRLINKGIQTSGDLLLELLSEKFTLRPEDKDMVIMLHRISYTGKRGEEQILKSLLKVKGENNTETAIAKTVGLPLGILAKLLLTGKIRLTGLHIPTHPLVYLPVLKELEQEGICFEIF